MANNHADLAALVLDLKESSDSKLKVLNDKLCDVEKRLIEQTRAVQEQTRQQKIHFALQNTDRKSFLYDWGGFHGRSSALLLADILYSFYKGVSFYLPDNARVHDEPITDANKETFRQKIVDELHTLLGTKPRLEQKQNGRYCLYYD